MSDFTIEQLEALKEGTTEGPWEAKPSPGAGVKGQREPDDEGRGPALIARMQMPWRAERHDANARLMAAAPDLVDALIAEKQAHQKLRAEIQRLQGTWSKPRPTRGDEFREGYQLATETLADILARVLEATDV